MSAQTGIRAARPAEYPEVLATVCAAFGERVRPLMTAMLWGDPTLTDGDVRVASVDGVIASVVRIADRPVRWGSDTLRLAGIGAVSTHPDYRGLGLASGVLGDAVRVMRERGFHLALLYTGIPAFYARLGWRPVAEPGFRVTGFPPLRGGEAPAGGSTGVRAFDPDRDLPAVMRVYDAANAGRFGPHLRGAAFWTCAQSRERHIMPALVAARRGEVIAYASTATTGTSLTLYEAGCLPGAEDAGAALAASVLAQASARGSDTIEGRLPLDHALRRAFARMEGANIAEVVHPGMMILPLDIPAMDRLAHAQGLSGWASLFEDGATPGFVYWWPDHF